MQAVLSATAATSLRGYCSRIIASLGLDHTNGLSQMSVRDKRHVRMLSWNKEDETRDKADFGTIAAYRDNGY